MPRQDLQPRVWRAPEELRPARRRDGEALGGRGPGRRGAEGGDEGAHGQVRLRLLVNTICGHVGACLRSAPS